MLDVLNIGDSPIWGYFCFKKLDNNDNITNVGIPKRIA
jgi:hypothetical protein